jgi:hypothetical protein
VNCFLCVGGGHLTESRLAGKLVSFTPELRESLRFPLIFLPSQPFACRVFRFSSLSFSFSFFSRDFSSRWFPTNLSRSTDNLIPDQESSLLSLLLPGLQDIPDTPRRFIHSLGPITCRLSASLSVLETSTNLLLTANRSKKKSGPPSLSPTVRFLTRQVNYQQSHFRQKCHSFLVSFGAKTPRQQRNRRSLPRP